jgi:hypothetical protein
MEPEGSLPHLQKPAICPYAEPAQSSPCPPSHFLNVHFNIILHSNPGLPGGLLPSGVSTKTLFAPLLSPYVLHAPPILFFS